MEDKSFETMYHRLGEIVKAIQKTDISLDDAFKLYKEGTALSKECFTYIENLKKSVVQQ